MLLSVLLPIVRASSYICSVVLSGKTKGIDNGFSTLMYLAEKVVKEKQILPYILTFFNKKYLEKNIMYFGLTHAL